MNEAFFGEKFWMVLIDGTHSCSFRHLTPESARAEADRLLRLSEHQGKAANILEVVERGQIKYPPEVWAPLNGIYIGEKL